MILNYHFENHRYILYTPNDQQILDDRISFFLVTCNHAILNANNVMSKDDDYEGCNYFSRSGQIAFC